MEIGAITKVLDDLKIQPLPEPPSRRSPFVQQSVVGGVVRYKPIDRASAMLLAKAPWWAKPPDEQKPPDPVKSPVKSSSSVKSPVKSSSSVKEIKTNTIPKTKNMSANINDTASFQIDRTKRPDVEAVMVGGEERVNIYDIAVKVIEEINRQPQKLTPLARAAVEAREVLEQNMKVLGSGMEDFNVVIKQHLEGIRQNRMAVVGEVSQLSTQLKDIRQFFLAPTYAAEIERLREFVNLCERLKALKDSGFLDTVADTMLRLAEPKK